MARTTLLEMCLSCMLRMSDKQLGNLVPLLTAAAGERLTRDGRVGALEARLFECLETHPDRHG